MQYGEEADHMLMKKLISMLVALCLALTLTAGVAVAEGGKQTASTVLDPDTEGVMVTVDLTGGWSVEFAGGALFLYDGEVTEDRRADAIGVTLEKNVYEEYLAEAADSDSRREIENGVCYTTEESTYYVIAVGSSAYFLLDVPVELDGDAILARIELVNEGDYYAALAEEQAAEEAALEEAAAE